MATIPLDKVYGIIQRMAQLWNEYRFTKLTEKLADSIDDPIHDPLIALGQGTQMINILVVKKEFARKYRRANSHKVCDDTYDDRYINKKAVRIEGYPVNVLFVTTKGRKLMDTIPFLPFIPYGVLRQWADTENRVLTFLIALGLGAGLKEIGKLIFTLLHNLPHIHF